jgi:putative RNA 2'-phosphotransferase
LVPEHDGFVKIKELLKAFCEEDGLKYVRRSHINEILIALPDPPIEIKDNLIRAKNRDKLPGHTLAQNLPKLLFTCVRRKAYPFVIEKGISPMGFSHVVLSSDRNMAERIGKRIDPMPIVLTVQTRKSLDKGTVFYHAGDTLFLAESILPDCFAGPPLPKQKPAYIQKETYEEHTLQKSPGSYLLEINDKKDRRIATNPKMKRKRVPWEEDKKRGKKHKLRKERPPWRR